MADEEEENLLQNTENYTEKNSEKQANYLRLVTGAAVLVLVDILWVGSAELSDYIFHNEGFDKPFFTTFFKTSAFVLYLLWICWRSLWCKFCIKDSSNNHFVPQDSAASISSGEILDEEHSQYSIDDGTLVSAQIEKLPLVKIMKVALIFCILWFLATFFYQEALAFTSPAVVNILSSSSGLFTLILAAIFQSSRTDMFSLSKLVAVLMSLVGIALVTFSDSNRTKGGVNYGGLFALAGAILYSCYLVLLKRKVPNEKQMDIATFFGFVGLFNILLLWPGFWLLHVTNIETFELPKGWKVWSSLVLNAVLGTVVSEYLWLWGCYLTSSLSATLALGMVMPLTMLTDIIRGRVHMSLMFVLGSIPIFVSFFIITYLCHYDNWDPVRTCLLTIYHWCSTSRTNNRSSYIN